MKTALVCIAKEEDHYIDEWLQYHFKLGFSNAFVYQNDWRYAGDRSQYGERVEWICFDGPTMQMRAYNDFIDNRSDGYDFAAFFDVDEFLCLKKFGSLGEFLSRYSDCYGVCVNWRMFGDSGLSGVAGNDYSVLGRFIMGEGRLDRHVKTILNMRLAGKQFHFVNPHFVDAALANDVIVDVDRTRFVRGPWNYGCECESAQLNHYHSKTWEEFLSKMRRGRADVPPSHYGYLSSDFTGDKFNEKADTAARDFFRGAVS